MSETRDTQPDAIAPERLEAAGWRDTDLRERAYDALKAATSLRNLGFNECHAGSCEGQVDCTGTTALRYSQEADCIERLLVETMEALRYTPAAPAAERDDYLKTSERWRKLNAERDVYKALIEGATQLAMDQVSASVLGTKIAELRQDGLQLAALESDLAALREQNAALEQQLAAARGEREEARKAARWMLPFLVNLPHHLRTAVEGWPWLDETITEQSK